MRKTVPGVRRHAQRAEHAGDVDDPGSLGAAQEGEQRVGDGDDPEDVGLIGAAHLVGGHLGHRRPVLDADPSVVDQYVKVAEGLLDPGGGALDRVCVGHVQLQEPYVRAVGGKFGGGCLTPPGVPGADQEVSCPLRQGGVPSHDRVPCWPR